MGHDLAQRDRLPLVRRNLEIEVGVDVLVEVELALFDLLHDRGPGDEFRHRSGAEQCPLGIDRRALVEVGIAKAARGQELAVLDHHHNGSGNVAAVQRERHIAVEPGIDVGLGQLMLGRFAGHRARRWLVEAGDRRGQLCKRWRSPQLRAVLSDRDAAKQDQQAAAYCSPVHHFKLPYCAFGIAPAGPSP